MSQAVEPHTINPSRRSIVAGLALAPIAGLPAIAGAVAGADPIFAAIERHKQVLSDFEDACNLTDEVRARNDGREITANDEAAFNAFSEAESAALDDLLALAPITRAGARAALEYIGDMDADEYLVEFAETLRGSPVLAG